MRTIRFISSTIAICVMAGAVVMLGSLSSAYSEEDKLKAVYPNKITRTVNHVCPQGSVKLFTVKLTVPRGHKIVEAGKFSLLLMSGRKRTSQPYAVNDRLVEYTVATAGRRARINPLNMRPNFAMVDYTSRKYSMELSSMCLEEPIPVP